MEKIIDFAADGTVRSLHQDSFNLGFLGDQKIERATDIVFNESTQKWNIRVLGPGRNWSSSWLSEFDGYDEARGFEVKWINRCMEIGADWRAGSSIATAIAEELRKEHDKR